MIASTDSKTPWGVPILESDERCRALIERLADPVLIVGPNGVLLWHSPAFERLGLGPGGTDPTVFGPIHTADVARLRTALADAVENAGQQVTLASVRVNALDGRVLRFDCSLTHWPDTPGIAGTLLVLHEAAGRIEAEDSAPDSADKYRSLVESAGDPIFTSDATGRFLYVNPAAAANLDATPDGVIGKSVDDFFPPEMAGRYRAEVERVIRTGEAMIAEERSEIHGQPRWYSTLVQPIRDPRGHVATAQLIARDITDLKNTEAALRESEERLRQVVSLFHIGFFDHDHVTNQMYWSPEHRQIYGLGPDEPVEFRDSRGVGGTAWAFIHPQDRERAVAAVDRAHRGSDGLFDLEYRIIRRDGQERWISTRAHTFFEGEGDSRRAVRTMGAVQDITDRKRAERQLLLTRASVEKCSIAIFWISPTGQVAYANERACLNLGYSPDELIGMHLWDFDPDFPSQRWPRVWEVVKERKSLTNPTRHRRKDGTIFPVEALGTYLAFEGEEHVVVFVQDITERERADRELRLMHAAIESSHVPFYALTPDGQIVYANEYASRGLGLLRRELIGRYVWEIDPDFPAEAQDKYFQDIRAAGMLQFQSRHRRTDGVMIPVEITTNYFSFKGEEYSLAFAQDITERKRAERHLQLTQTSIDNCNTAIYWLTTGGRITYVNKHACQSLALSPEELIGRFVWEFDPDFSPERWSGYAIELKQRKSFTIETHHRREDGSTFPVEVLGNYVVFEGEEHFFAFVHDISDRKRAEQALRENEERLRQVARVYDIGIFDHNFLTGEVYWSPELRKFWKLDDGEAVSLAMIMKAIHPEDADLVDRAVRLAVDPRGSGRYSAEHRVIRRDGSVRWIDTRSQTFFAGEGSAKRQARTVGAMVDVTARVEAEEALRHSLREKETLLREVHHRVKNNLQIIASLLHFQAKKIRDPADLAAFAEGRDRLRSMILVHEKLYQSRDLSRIDFGSYLESLVRELRRSHAANGQSVEVRLAVDEVSLPIESALPCGMILCELLTNVFKYAFPGGRRGEARIILSRDDGRVSLSVEDDGVGLPAGFDPEHTSSFGWQLIRNLTAQLGGQLAIGRETGTRVTVSFEHERPGV